jgi:hypothetical protein
MAPLVWQFSVMVKLTLRILQEMLTLTCTGGTLALAYSVPAEDYRVSSLTGLAEPGISINGTNYSLDETAFTALKSAGNNGVIKITSSNTAISKNSVLKG